jgi:alkanesulfonate monooxygenase SsuD/methylene tetrahydromethanopterin reductase-like flavin-dependent oxidoreductase (luciferase family)
VDRHRHDLDGARTVPEHGAHAGARLLRLHPARRLSYVGESFGGSTEIYLKNAIAVPRQDPSVVAALMTQVTSRIGIVPTFGTYAYHPYLLARLVATLDQVSGGRIGWNAVTGSSDFAAMNFGMRACPARPAHDMADEYMEVCRGLWGSWEPGALVADRKNGVLVDHTKVHAVNYQGKYFSTRGPLTWPAPQASPSSRRPGGSPRGGNLPPPMPIRSSSTPRASTPCAPIARTCMSTWSRRAASLRTARCCS